MSVNPETPVSKEDPRLIALVAILGIMTAFTAFLSGSADGRAVETFFEAQSHLSNANFFYLQGNQDVLYDFENYDRYVIEQGVDDFASEYYFNILSDAALDSIDRPDGPFDDAYFNEIYADGIAEDDQASLLFDQAKFTMSHAGRLDMVVFILGVGLSFAAWASLLDHKARSKRLFTLFAWISLSVSLISLAIVYLIYFWNFL